jgi:hypothetical protein
MDCSTIIGSGVITKKGCKMANWKIKYYTSESGKADLEKWFNKLSTIQFKSVDQEIELLREYGNSLGLPHSRSMGKSLFELRERKFGYRIYYTF